MFSPLTSNQVLAFLPLNTWTEVILLSNGSTDNGIYIATTEEKEKKRKEDADKILIQSISFDKIKEFKALEIVAVEINGKWYRGKLISFNEFQDDNTRMELIDIGSIHQTKLQNVFVLPYYFMYQPLALPIKFKNFIPKTTKLKIRPLLSESLLYDGVVLVDVDCDNFELKNNYNGQREEIKKNLKFDCDSSISSIQKMTNGFANVSCFRKGSCILNQQKSSFDIPFKNGDCCIITYFDDFTSVYIVKASIHDSYIMSKTAIRTGDISVKCYPVVGDIIKVFSLSKDSYCRAKILNNYNDGWYNVQYIDYGNVEKVSFKNFHELDDELKKKPGLAVKIGMSDLLHSQCSEEIRNLFTTFIKEKKVFVIEFDEKVENCLEQVKLKEENGSYLNFNYLKKYLSMKNTSTNKIQELNHFHSTENIPISSNYEEHTNNGHQKIISSTKCNSENNFDKFSVENSRNVENNLINKTQNYSISDFQNVTLANGDLCLVSFFKNFNNIYLCKAVKNGEFYESHNTSIVVKTASNIEKKIKKCPAVGDIVKAYSTEFPAFYRAEILNIENDGSLLVSYIDFGNTEILLPSDIFELSDELLDREIKLPVRVSIQVPSNSKETEEIKRLFDNLITNDIVLSIEFNEKNINGLENVNLKYLESGKSVNNEVLQLLPAVKIPIKNTDTCILTHFDDLDNIYVSKGHTLENSNFLNSVINSTDRKFKKNPHIKDIVKVLSPTFNDFYRAKILNIKDNGDFHVFYIDFGNTEVVQSNNVFELSDDFKMKPELAIKIGMKLPSYVKLNEEIKAMFLNLAEETSKLSIEFDDTSEFGLQNCILKMISNGLNVNEEVLKLFSTQSPMSPSVENLGMKVQKSINSPKVDTFKLRNGEAIFLTYFENLTEIFVRKASEDHIYFDLLTKVCEDKSEKNLSNIKIGDIVKVPYDGMMCRAQILDKKDKDNYYISFIDFGNKQNVHASQIFEISDELKKNTSFCIKIGMKGSFKIGQSTIVEDYFKKLEGLNLFIEYDEDNPNGLQEASLKKEDNIDIFVELCKTVDKSINIEGELIQKSENTQENNIILSNLSEIERMPSNELKNGDIVFCSNFEDFDQIYLSKSSKNKVVPENFNMIIDPSKLKDITVRKNPKFEEIVWVKFEGKMVRAKVLNKSEDMYSVFLVDLGKFIRVPSDDVFEISKDLKQIPGLAIKVGLKKTQDLKTNKAIKEYFHRLWYNEPVPLTLMCDEGNFNYLNEVNLKKSTDGRDIIDDLFEICDASNDIPNKLNYVAEDKKSSIDDHEYFLNGDYVEFVSGNNIDNIYIRSVKLFNSYKNILEQLQKENRDNLKTTIPKIYEIVAVYSLKYHGFIRAKILTSKDDDNSKLRCALIDFGCVDLFNLKDIFTLPYYADKVPFICHRVTLADLTKITINNDIITYLTSNIGKTFVLEYDTNAKQWFKQVVLKDLKNGKSINEEIHQLLASRSQQRRLERKIVVNETKIKEIKTEKPRHAIRSGSCINIVHFENFNSIYIRDASYEYLNKFCLFNIQMKKYYRHSNNIRIKEMINVGDKVCVSTTVNQVMYCRALVLEKIGDGYNVFNVDYGNKELVNSNDIFELPEELEKFSYFAVQVQLQNMPKLTTKNEFKIINDYFQKKIIGNNSQLIIEFNELNPKGLNDVIFRTEYYKKDIADDLRNLLNAPPLNIKTGLCQTTENHSLSTATGYPSPIPARKRSNLLKTD